MLDDLSLQVQSIYEDLDKSKKTKSESTCPCYNPHPNVTLLEMLPMALEISTSPDRAEIFKRLKSNPLKCIFQIQSMLSKSKAECNQMHYRPTPCRLSPKLNQVEWDQLTNKIKALAPSWGEERMPINQALLLALEKILLLSEVFKEKGGDANDMGRGPKS
jgi:hypothetical protein